MYAGPQRKYFVLLNNSPVHILIVIFSFFCVIFQLALEDPVHSVSLQQFVYEKLKAQQALMGDQGFGVLMETVDTELVRQLQEFLQGLWITITILHYLTQTSLPNATLYPHFWKFTEKANNLPNVWTPIPNLPNLYPCYALSIFRPSLVDCRLLTLCPFLYYLDSFTYFFYQDEVYVSAWKCETFLKQPHRIITTLELPHNSSSFFSFCGLNMGWVEYWRDKLEGVEESIAKIICRCQSRSLGLFSMEQHSDCSRNMDKTNLKDLKQCLQNLFLKEKKKCNFVCM